MHLVLQDMCGPHMGEGKFGADKGRVSTEEVSEDPCVIYHLMT